MCGIAGILRLTTSPGGDGTLPPGEALVPQRWLEVLDRAIAHRGPDGYGVFRDRAVRRDGTVADVALVHRRLAIIDPAGGRQPMVDRTGIRTGTHTSTHTGPTAVVFNGHIANHRALRAELCRGGAGFVSDHSDTEVLLRGWQAWGTGLGGRLDGMWAAAIWQGGVGEHAGQVWLTRDRAHEKPLYVGEAAAADEHGGRVLVFASTAAAVLGVLAMLGRRPTMTAEQTERWLRFGAAESASTGCRSWPGRGTVDDLESDLSDEQSLEASGLPLERATEAWLDADAVDAMIASAVRLRLDADVPVGCFLSGGVDSGLIAWHAQAALQEAGAGRLRTFTVRMPGADALGGHDESAIAALTAAHVGSEHRVLDCRGSAAQDMVALIEQLGHPLGDSSLLPTAWLSRAVREHVGVALSGEGADEADQRTDTGQRHCPGDVARTRRSTKHLERAHSTTSMNRSSSERWSTRTPVASASAGQRSRPRCTSRRRPPSTVCRRANSPGTGPVSVSAALAGTCRRATFSLRTSCGAHRRSSP